MASHRYLLYHIVFSTKERRELLKGDDFRASVWAYMAGVAKNLGGFPVKIGGYYDHAHLLVRIPAKVAVSDFVGQLKANTSKHINESSGWSIPFRWQDGYGAFTVSRSQEASVANYIDRQMEHHKKHRFQDEYLEMLKKHDVEFNPKYLWE